MIKIAIVFFSFFILIDFSFAETDYYLTLRSDKVNLRQGPSLDHPIKLKYTKKFLPVLILDKSYNFRKVIDHENNSGWIHISQLSKKKAAIVIKDELIMFSNSTLYSNPIALLKKGRLVKIKKCNDNWCKATSGDFKGWLKKESLWGLF